MNGWTPTISATHKRQNEIISCATLFSNAPEYWRNRLAQYDDVELWRAANQLWLDGDRKIAETLFTIGDEIAANTNPSEVAYSLGESNDI